MRWSYKRLTNERNKQDKGKEKRWSLIIHTMIEMMIIKDATRGVIDQEQ